MLYFVTLPTSTHPLTRTPFLRRWNPLRVPKPGAPSLRFQADSWIPAARRMSRSPSQGWNALCKDFLFFFFFFDIHANSPPLIQAISMISATYYSNIVFHASSAVHIPWSWEIDFFFFFPESWTESGVNRHLGVISMIFFYYLSAAIGNRERVRVLSKLAHGDILGGGNGKIMSYRNSKARILTSCQTAAMLASAARRPRVTPSLPPSLHTSPKAPFFPASQSWVMSLFLTGRALEQRSPAGRENTEQIRCPQIPSPSQWSMERAPSRLSKVPSSSWKTPSCWTTNPKGALSGQFSHWIPIRFFVTGNMTNGMCYCITEMLFIWFCPF